MSFCLFCLLEAFFLFSFSSATDIFPFLKLHFLIFIFWPCHVACGILVPWPGIDPGPLSVRARSPNNWIARKFPQTSFLYCNSLSILPFPRVLVKKHVREGWLGEARPMGQNGRHWALRHPRDILCSTPSSAVPTLVNPPILSGCQ